MKNKLFLIVFLSFFVFFILILFAHSQGYYKTRAEKAKYLTDKQIIEFEKDVSQGKDIDIKKYVLYEDKDYTNNVSDNVYKVSLRLEKIIDASVRMIFDKTSKAVND